LSLGIFGFKSSITTVLAVRFLTWGNGVYIDSSETPALTGWAF
jgi:hypothetical protein